MNDAEAFRVALGRVLRTTREDNGATQAWVAGVVGLTQASISNYESGKRDIAYVHVLSIVTAFGLRHSDFHAAVRREYEAQLAGTAVAA